MGGNVGNGTMGGNMTMLKMNMTMSSPPTPSATPPKKMNMTMPKMNMTMPKMNMTMSKAPTKKFISALDATNFMKYDMLVQACLATGAKCIIDIHNYARFNDQIIGQGGPTNEQFADL
jgi:endoglucanase